jgi:hypothetical protein
MICVDGRVGKSRAKGIEAYGNRDDAVDFQHPAWPSVAGALRRSWRVSTPGRLHGHMILPSPERLVDDDS